MGATLIRPMHWGLQRPPAGASVHYGHPLARDLVGAWTLSEQGGRLLTNAVGGMPMLVHATPVWTAAAIGAALNANNLSNDAVATTALLATPNGYTAAIWYRGATTPGAGAIRQPLRCGTTGDIWGMSWDHSSGAFQQAWFHKNASGTYFAAKYTTALAANQWYCLVGTWDGASLHAYVNGRLDTTTPGVANLASASGVFAYGQGAGSTMTGDIGPVYVWSRALHAQEIAWLAAEPYAMFAPPAPTQCWWILAATPQLAAPTADVSDGSWTNDAGNNTNLYASLDETAAADSDYIQSSINPSSDAVTLELADLVDPLSSSDHKLRYRIRRVP